MGARRRGAPAAAPAVPDARWATTLATTLADSGATPRASRAPGARRKRAVGGGGSPEATATKAREAVRDAARALFARLTRAVIAGEGARTIALPLGDELVVDGLDCEQVWTQVDAQTAPVLAACKRAVRALGGKGARGGEIDVDKLFRVSIDEGEGGSDDDESEDEGESDEGGGEDESEDDDEGRDDRRAKSGKKSSGSDRTAQIFQKPGMFSLDEMESFMDQGDVEEEKRRRANEEVDGGSADEEGESDDDMLDIYGDMSDSDEDGDENENSDEEDDLDDALAYTAKLAGVSASARKKKSTRKATKGKKAQDLMFEDFFGKRQGQPLGGRKGGKLGASTDAELNELSDEEEDMFNELEDGEDDDEEDDDLDGELETGIAGSRGIENHDDDADEYDDEEEEDEEDELVAGDEEELDELDRKLDADLDAELARAEAEGEDGDSDAIDDDEKEVPRSGPKSAFQRQQEALGRQIEKLEAAAIGEKSWLLKGEAAAKERPMNSALETDLEFEHVMAPAPVISAEITQKLEEIIKQRIIEGRFDDVERVEPVEERERKELPQLDDTKSTKGLGDIYADEYMRQKAGVALGEKEDPMVAEVKKLWATLSYRLDVLLQTGEVEDPKDLEKKIDRELAARAKGNIVPLTFDESKRLAPEEVFAGGEGKGGQRGSAAGAVKADDELTKEERKAGRAKRKRKSKAAQEEKDRVKAKRDRAREAQHKAEEDAGFTRKAPKVAMLAVGSAAGKSKSDFSKSSKVFGMLQDAKDADAARGGVAKKSKSDSAKNKPSLKL